MAGIFVLLSWPLGIAVVGILWVLYYVTTAIRDAFFHPLSSFPGPRFASFSKIPFAYHMVSGDMHLWTEALHDTYGEVVRYSPNHLSFATPDAWKDIYNYRTGVPHFTKDKMNYFTPPSGVDSLHSTDDDAVHIRQRRLLSHAFSDTALRAQEHMIQKYVNLLLDKLYERCRGPEQGKTDIVRLLNWTTFDLIGDLTFGESFHCLEDNAYHPWIALVFDYMVAAVFMVASKQFPLFDRILQKMIPKRLTQRMRDHARMSAERMGRRLATKTDRPDFVTYLVGRTDDPESINVEEMHSNSTLIILGGSETAATALSGALYYMSKNRQTFDRLVKEVRSSITKEEDLNILKTSHLTYLTACLEETMRIYPPVAGYLPRRAPKEGCKVAGYWVPPYTQVSITPYAINHFQENFKDPKSFVPERWLSEGSAMYSWDRKQASQPFSVGPRNCIGKNLAWAEMRLILSKLLWHFDIEVCEESKDWGNQKTYLLWQKPALVLQLKPVVDR